METKRNLNSFGTFLSEMQGQRPKGIGREVALKSVGPGWTPLVKMAYDFLPEGAVVTCVKEKFGELRIYVDYATEPYQELLDVLETASGLYCEDCGSQGHWNGVTTESATETGWIRTLCRKCREAKNEISA